MPHGSVPMSASGGAPVDLSRCLYVTFYFVGVGTLAGGVVTIEEAPTRDYTGTWFSVTTFNAVDVNGGATKAVRLTAGAYAFVRLRVTTPVSGGGTLTAIVEATPILA